MLLFSDKYKFIRLSLIKAPSGHYIQLRFFAQHFFYLDNYQYSILNKCENAILLSIFYEKVLDKKYLLKLNNVAQTSTKRFVETPPICLV